MPSELPPPSRKLTKVDSMPKQYAKPLRKTAYLHAYPHVVNGGILYKNHEVAHRTADLPDDELMNLFRDNEVSFTPDRVKDARSIPWTRT